MKIRYFFLLSMLFVFSLATSALAKENWQKLTADEYITHYYAKDSISLVGPMQYQIKLKNIPTLKGMCFEEYKYRSRELILHIDLMAETFYTSHFLQVSLKGKSMGTIEAGEPTHYEYGSLAMLVAKELEKWTKEYFQKHPDEEETYFEICTQRLKNNFPEKYQEIFDQQQ